MDDKRKRQIEAALAELNSKTGQAPTDQQRAAVENLFKAFDHLREEEGDERTVSILREFAAAILRKIN